MQGTGLHAHDLVEENHESFLDFFLCQADFLLETKWIGDAIVLLHVVLQGVVEKVEVLLTMAKLVNSLKIGGGAYLMSNLIFSVGRLMHTESLDLSFKVLKKLLLESSLTFTRCCPKISFMTWSESNENSLWSSGIILISTFWMTLASSRDG